VAANKNPYDSYANNRIFTASKEELSLMLYDGALKFCNQAIAALEADEEQKALDLIVRVQDIIREFQMTLDMQYSISQDLTNIYEYIHRRLGEARQSKELEILDEMRDLIRGLRDTWKEAMVIAKKEQTQPPKAQPGA